MLKLFLSGVSHQKLINGLRTSLKVFKDQLALSCNILNHINVHSPFICLKLLNQPKLLLLLLLLTVNV